MSETASNTVQGISIRTIYVQPQYREDNEGNRYMWYVWEGAEVAVVLETAPPEVDDVR